MSENLGKVKPIFTIGHGLRNQHEFLCMLHDFYISVLVDVRSVPFTRRAPQFKKPFLSAFLKMNGIAYNWKGETLGGLNPVADEIYLPAIERLLTVTQQKNTVLMCSESDYKKCHRCYKLSETLERKGFPVFHITGRYRKERHVLNNKSKFKQKEMTLS